MLVKIQSPILSTKDCLFCSVRCGPRTLLFTGRAEVAELVDALDSGSSGVTPVGVQISSSAPDPSTPKPEERIYLGFVERLKSNLKKSVDVLSGEGAF